MKVLILSNSSKGLHAFRNDLIVELTKRYQVFIAVPDDVSVMELSQEGCKIIPVAMNRRGINPFEDFRLYIAYRRLLCEIKPDLVLTYTIKPNIYGGFACSRKKVKYISTITGLGTAFQKEGFFKKVIVKMYQISLKKAECIFFQNRQNREIFDSYHIHGKKSILVQGSGVDLSIHNPEEYPKNDQIRFLFIGRIMKEKGIDEFLDAAKVLHNDGVSFEILGTCDEDYTETLNLNEKEGYIRYLGFHNEVHNYIKNASAIVLPTYHEGMSNVLMEASATGRPVIATNISGCKEIFEEGVTGFGCTPRSSESLISALRKFMGLSIEARAEMGKRARMKMEQEFDRRLVTDVYINEVNDVLNTDIK